MTAFLIRHYNKLILNFLPDPCTSKYTYLVK